MGWGLGRIINPDLMVLVSINSLVLLLLCYEVSLCVFIVNMINLDELLTE